MPNSYRGHTSIRYIKPLWGTSIQSALADPTCNVTYETRNSAKQFMVEGFPQATWIAGEGLERCSDL